MSCLRHDRRRDVSSRAAIAGGDRGRAGAGSEAFVAELSSLVVSASLGSQAAAEAVLACALWLLDRGASRVPELHAIAMRDGHAVVALLLGEALAHRGLAPGGRLPPLAVPETARVLRRLFTTGDDYSFKIDGIRLDPMPRLLERPAPLPPVPETLAPLDDDFVAAAMDEPAQRTRGAGREPLHPGARRAPPRGHLPAAARGLAAVCNVHPRVRELAHLVEEARRQRM